jgi:excisionase family DNA binding protein
MRGVTSSSCANCGRPASLIWDDGSPTCDRCRPGTATAARPIGTPPPPSERPPLTVEEAAAREAVSVRTVYRWLASGALQGHRVGREWRIPIDALEARRTTAQERPKQPEPPKRRRRRRKAAPVAGDGGWWPS